MFAPMLVAERSNCFAIVVSFLDFENVSLNKTIILAKSRDFFDQRTVHRYYLKDILPQLFFEVNALRSKATDSLLFYPETTI